MKQFGVESLLFMLAALTPEAVVHAWVLTPLSSSSVQPLIHASSTIGHYYSCYPEPSFRASLVVCKAGFGASDEKSKKKEAKLKPKQMWDRYLELKKENKVVVGVRVNENDGEWFQVGAVKSKENKYTELAVARQRALIAEHARRLFPLQVSAKSQVEWGYKNGKDEWILVDKSVLDDSSVPSNLDKEIGFEGRPDPGSGYYCYYNEGRLVNSETDVRPSSKKLR